MFVVRKRDRAVAWHEKSSKGKFVVWLPEFFQSWLSHNDAWTLTESKRLHMNRAARIRILVVRIREAGEVLRHKEGLLAVLDRDQSRKIPPEIGRACPQPQK